MRFVRPYFLLIGFIAAWLIAACTQSNAPGSVAPGTTRQEQAVGGLQVTFDSPVDQLTNREQILAVHLRDERGQPVHGATVQFDLAMPMLCVNGSQPMAREITPGTYQAEAFYAMSGSWNVIVRINRAGGQQTTLFPVQVREDPTRILNNPFANDRAAVETGAVIYASNCASCHGDTGRGNGPAGVGLQPPPADLTAHLANGKHSDGEVFRWIRDGIGNTGMPAFGATLSENDRWQLISYLRSLSSVQPADVSGPLPPLIFVQAGNLYYSDGTNAAQQVPATSGLGGFERPVFSPDGQRIAAVVNQGTPVEKTGRFTIPTLYILRPDGTELQSLWYAQDQGLSAPFWTPDGKAIVVTARTFTSTGDGGGSFGAPELVRVDIATGDRTTLVSNAMSPAFSPDGTMLVYVQGQAIGSGNILVIAHPDGKEPRPVVGGSFAGINAPRFSPDGELIVFSAAGGPPVDAEGRPMAFQEPGILEQAFGWLAPPAVEAHGGNWEVWSVQSDGSDLRRLTQLATHDTVAAFSPDGTEIVIGSEEGIHIVSRDGGTLRRLNPVMTTAGIDWRPLPPAP